MKEHSATLVSVEKNQINVLIKKVNYYNGKKDKKISMVLQIPLDATNYHLFRIFKCAADGSIQEVHNKLWWWLKYPKLKYSINRRQHEAIYDLWTSIINDITYDDEGNSIAKLSKEDIITIVNNIFN